MMDYKQSYEELEENFRRELLKSNKLLEAINKMETKYTTEEMFSYIWSLDEAHRFLTPVLLPSSKSKDSSHVYCRQGDIAHKLCNLDKALKLYNLAILSAPHPAIMTGNSLFDNNTRENTKQLWNEVYVDLARAYESRSALLFDMEQYGKCSNDIDRALELECLESSQRNKLLEMKDRCQKMSSKDKAKTMSASAMAFNSSHCSFAYVNPKPPKLAECNPSMPSFSSAVKLAYSHSQGRHMIANRDIIPGEILSIDEGYCSVIYQEKLKVYCVECAERCLVPLPCPTCSLVIFCSVSCRTQGYHWQECSVLPTLYELGNKTGLYLLYRLLVKTSHPKIKTMIPLLQQEAKDQPPETLGFNKDGIYDPADYRTVYHLVTNKEKLHKNTTFTFSTKAFILTKLLLQGYYFLDDDGNPFTPNHEDIILTGSTLIHHIMSSACNVREIQYWKEIVNNNKMSELETSGFAVYPSDLMNHACNANCNVFFYGKTEVVRAVHFIPADRSLTVSYGNDFTSADRDFRRAEMMQAFHFICTCEACKNDWPNTINLPKQQIILKCLKCDNAINPTTKLCSVCKLNYNKQGEAEAMGGLYAPPYSYSDILTKVEKIQNEFLKIKENICKGSKSEENVKVVRILIKLFCTYVHQPNFILQNAEHVLQTICNRFGSRIYVKNQNPISPECPVS